MASTLFVTPQSAQSSAKGFSIYFSLRSFAFSAVHDYSKLFANLFITPQSSAKGFSIYFSLRSFAFSAVHDYSKLFANLFITPQGAQSSAKGFSIYFSLRSFAFSAVHLYSRLFTNRLIPNFNFNTLKFSNNPSLRFVSFK